MPNIYIVMNVHGFNSCKGTLAKNSNFLILLSLQHYVVDLWYFKLWILLVQIVKVWNVRTCKDKGFEN